MVQVLEISFDDLSDTTPAMSPESPSTVVLMTTSLIVSAVNAVA
jgi:hypothetical protein